MMVIDWKQKPDYEGCHLKARVKKLAYNNLMRLQNLYFWNQHPHINGIRAISQL
jgi:hypothetical protein